MAKDEDQAERKSGIYSDVDTPDVVHLRPRPEYKKMKKEDVVADMKRRKEAARIGEAARLKALEEDDIDPKEDRKAKDLEKLHSQVEETKEKIRDTKESLEVRPESKKLRGTLEKLTKKLDDLEDKVDELN